MTIGRTLPRGSRHSRCSLETGSVPRERFREHEARSPLPRAFQWIDGSAYLSHVELVRKARGAAMPPELFTDPLLYQGGSDAFLSPREPIRMPDEECGHRLRGAKSRVIVKDVPMGAGRAEAAASIVLVVLVNDVSLRNLIPAELAKGFGFFQSKPSSAFSPVAVTPDELGAAWDGGRLHLPLLVSRQWRSSFGRPDAGAGMHFDFPALYRPCGKDKAFGSWHHRRVRHRFQQGGGWKPRTARSAQGGVGYSCLAEARMVETLARAVRQQPNFYALATRCASK